jgi:hypothetical protein
MPPKSAADFASPALAPDCVCSPVFSFSGGAHATRPASRRTDAAQDAINREDFIGEPSDGQEAARWRSGVGAESSR